VSITKARWRGVPPCGVDREPRPARSWFSNPGDGLIAAPEAGASPQDTLPHRLQQVMNALKHGDAPRKFYQILVDDQ